MKYGFDLSITGEYANPGLLADMAAEAEQSGWDGVFVWDCLIDPNTSDGPTTDPWMALVAIALKTHRIKSVSPLIQYL